MSIKNAGFRVRAAVALGVILLAAFAGADRVYAARSGNLLVVVPTGYNGSTPVTQFINSKEAQGLTVQIYVVPSGTNRSAIKTYIESLWQTADQPDYIVLVGDEAGSSSTATTIPYWTGTGDKGAPTDWPYGCMPGGIDWYPDIPVGRLSANTTAQLQNIVNKTLFVEAGDFPDDGYVKRAGFLAQYDTAGLAVPTHTWVIDTYLEPLGFETTLIDDAAGGNNADITNTLNEGCLFFTYMGHSSSSHWYGQNFDFNQSNVNALSNTGMYGLVCGWSCNTSNYPYDECIGETWLRAPNKGAAVYISASTYIYWGSYDNWIMSAEHTKAVFASFFEDDIWEVGPAWVNGFYRFLESYGGWNGDMNTQPPLHLAVCHNFLEEFVILGDPSLLLPTQALRLKIAGDLPVSVLPGVETPIQLRIEDGGESLLEGSGMFYYRFDGGDFISTPLIHNSGVLYDAVLPATDCSGYPEFYFSAESVEGTTIKLPSSAPTSTFSIVIGEPELVISENFENSLGWTTSYDGATAGLWEVGVPVNDPGWVYDPESDSDGSGQCFLTGNYAGNSDLDNGSVTLTSPTLDLSGPGVSIKYDYYLFLTNEIDDAIFVEVNTADGVGAWTEIARHETNGGLAWRTNEVTHSELAAMGVTPTATTKVRFTAVDAGTQSIVEAGVDAFEIVGYECHDICLGDFNEDGFVNLSDLAKLLSNYGAGSAQYKDGDIDGDGDVDLADLAGLLSVYGIPCP